jgi:hypothetical protein
MAAAIFLLAALPEFLFARGAAQNRSNFVRDSRRGVSFVLCS